MHYDNYSYWRPRPTQNDFQLEVVSKHPDFNGRTLKAYAVDGINTVGCWGDEPFEVHFHNRSVEDVQVRISLDGTDILTGKAADLEINPNMWVVRAGRTLHLKAWAENSNGGARFVFTSGDMSVALHAHGDVSHKGIISAAVFTERDRPTPPVHTLESTRRRAAYYQGGGMQTNSSRGMLGAGASFNAVPAAAPAAGSAPVGADFESFGADRNLSDARSEGMMKSLKKSAAVGAGEYVEQKTRTVKGLDHPVLNSIVRVRYMWWDDLQARLKDSRHEDPHPTGFPAEKIKTFADLSGVPRVTSAAASRVVEPTRTVSAPSPVRTEQTFSRTL